MTPLIRNCGYDVNERGNEFKRMESRQIVAIPSIEPDFRRYRLKPSAKDAFAGAAVHRVGLPLQTTQFEK